MEHHISRDKNILIKHNRFPHFIGAFPPAYCEQKNQFVIPKDRIKLYILPVVFFAMSIDILYLWIYIFPKINSYNVNAQEFINFNNHIISRSLGCIIAWVFYFQMHDLMQFTNVMFKMEKQFEGIYICFSVY